MMYTADTPIAEMLADTRAALVAAAEAEGIKGFDPEKDCVGYQWWLQQKPQTVGAFIDHLVAAAVRGEADQGWLYTLIRFLPDKLYPEAREKLVKALTGDRAVMVSLTVDDLTDSEKAHLKPICIERYSEKPSLRRVVEEKMTDV
jgi:hypothetical protein